MKYHIIRVVVVFCIVGLVGMARGSPLYSVTNLGTLPGGEGFASNARDINAYGQVVGTSPEIGGSSHGFLWTPTTPNAASGSMIDLGILPGGDTSSASGINNLGQIVGSSNVTAFGTNNRAFLWTPTTPNGTTGSKINLGDLPGGSDSSNGTRINASGQVVGRSSASTGTRAFLWNPVVANGTTGSLIDLGDLPDGTDSSSANDINDFGQVTGKGQASTGGRAFLWTPTAANGTSGSMIDLGAFVSVINESDALGINASGRVVGWSNLSGNGRAVQWIPTTPNGTTLTMDDIGYLGGPIANDINTSGQIVGSNGLAFLWTPSDLWMDLNTLLDASGAGWTLESASAINDLGQIVGRGQYDPDGAGGNPAVFRAFLLTPVPEPTIGVLVLMIALALPRRRNRA